jgi:hypothetical protein
VVQVYLSRRNLLILLSKLDRKKQGESSECTIVKLDNKHPIYKQSHSPVRITAVEDEEYYAERPPGEMLELDEQNIDKYKF